MRNAIAEDDVAFGKKKLDKDRIDPGWPEVDHPVSELAADRQGSLSPFGEVTFPQDAVPYVHPETEINRVP